MRAHLGGDANAEQFGKLLLQVGNGRVPIAEEPDTVIIPEQLGMVTDCSHSLIERVYPHLQQHSKNLDWLMERAILAPHNESISNLNWDLLNKFPGDMKIYKSVDAVKDEDAVHYSSEFLNTLEPPGMPPHRLALKVGIPIMVLRNLAPGIANGTRLIVKRMMTNCQEATIATGPHKGQDVYLPKIPLIPSDTGLPFDFRRLQFPVKVCFAMTINKAQGQTLAVAGLDLHEPAFSHGQLYVAISRVASRNGLTIFAKDGKTRNIVYQEVLSPRY